MGKRSPILGYNHNIRHRGLVFHVQTEDSGVDNPHVFTHLFHGGVIITSRRLDYDPEAAEDAIKGLMQAQHKAVLRELKRGEFTEKIDSYLGNNPDLLPFEPEDDVATPAPERIDAAADATEPVAAPSPVDAAEATEPIAAAPPPELTATPPSRPPHRERSAGGQTQPIGSKMSRPAPQAPVVHLKPPPALIDEPDTDPFVRHDVNVPRPAEVSAAFDAIVASETGAQPSEGTAQIHSPAPASAPEPPGARPHSPGAYSQHRPAPRKPVPSSVEPDDRPTGRVSRVPRSPPPVPKQPRSKRSGVVVSRPAVIVGAPSKVIGGKPSDTPTEPPGRASRGRKAAKPPAEGLFGQGLISEKSLDEVILAYLSDDGNDE